MQIVSNQGVKCPDAIGNLMCCANNYIPGEVIQNSIGIVEDNAKAFYTRLCVLAP